jgi:hypothetical protein
MKTILLALLLLTHDPRELSLAREMLEDAVIRNDAEGLRLVRQRLEASDTRDAHYLIALAVNMELFTGYRDTKESAELLALGLKHADKAVELDPKFAEGWMMAALMRGNARRLGVAVPPDPEGTPNRLVKAMELDANAPGVAFWNGMLRSFNPAGPAPAESVTYFENLTARLDKDRAATGRRFGLWDAYAHAWLLFVRMATEDPNPAALRPAAERLLKERPDFALGQQIAAVLAERRFVDAPDVRWQPVLIDAKGDGSKPALPDIVSVDRADRDDRVWYRVTFAEALPRSFGVNLIFDRDGDPSNGMTWWGNGSTFRFERLVTAWITRDGDRYTGTVGITDDLGARAARLMKLSNDVQLAIGERALMLSIPRDVAAPSMIAAAGSHLVWNDDATSASNSR